jgi:hypothetical protein
LFRNSNYDHDEESIFAKKITINYIEGLDWVFQYYVKGCPNWKWKYNYNYPPLLRDLALYFPNHTSGFSHFCKTTSVENLSFSSKVQLAYVIPFSCFNEIIKDCNINVLLNDKYIKYFQINQDINLFQWAFCRFFWESHIILPKISLNILEEWETQLTD